MSRGLRAYGYPIPAFPLSLLSASLILPQRLVRPSSLRLVVERLVGKVVSSLCQEESQRKSFLQFFGNVSSCVCALEAGISPRARPRNKKRRGPLPPLPLKNVDVGDGENCQDRNG
ncbi:hypothetical protein MRB53_000500 [Persea americana]|uniref:Uncharacterized protein n=1 Tax=Persea americana TaxID=3435 RepID=A0ACC2MRE3_PERAE|nr:hypothetical protein MRB53_000500 [Persea americana]